MPMPAEPPRRGRPGSEPERTVQPSRFSWFTVIAGICIAASGAYFLAIGHNWTWFSVVQVGVGIWMVVDGGLHLLRRWRLLGGNG